MITYKNAKFKNSFCQCKECINSYREEDETGFWEVCAACALPIELKAALFTKAEIIFRA